MPDVYVDAWQAVLGAHASVTTDVERALREAELPPLPWYDVLWSLRRSPDRRLRMSALAEAVTLSRGGLTKLVDRIETAGLLRREACTTDRRGYDAVLTDEGNEMLRRMWPVYSGVLRRRVVSALTVTDAEVLAQTLGRLATER